MALSPLHTFKNKYLDDLAFILRSAELFQSSGYSFTIDQKKVFNWLKTEQLHPEQINAQFESYDIRKLGWYAEKLVEYFFSNCDDYRLIANNIQLFDGKITKGEIDFLVEDLATNTIIQVELATKYYIKYNSQYIGPNAKDNLEKKYNRLVNHQLLKETPEEALLLTENKAINFSKHIVKGYLFYPYTDFIEKRFSFPQFIHPTHQKGWHLTFDQLLSQEVSHLYYLPKTEWLGASHSVIIEKNQFETFFKEVFEFSRAIMVLDEHNNRGFITSNNWPNTD